MLNVPDPEAERLIRAAMQAFNGGDRKTARAAAQQVLLRRPADPRAHQILGVTALDVSDFAAARRHLEAALKVSPTAIVYNLLGVSLEGLGDTEGACAAFNRAGELGLIDGWRNLASIEIKRGASDAAVAAYERALSIAPHDAATHGSLAHLRETRHDLASAKRHAEAGLTADPGNDTARVALARVLLREKDFAGAETVAAPLAHAPSAKPEHRVIALGLIGDARDRAGDADGAFAAFAAANRISLQLHASWLNATGQLYHPVGVRSMTEFLAAADIASWRQRAAFTTPAPAFLVGFPRSGTTLLDQILSSHSNIVCLEEREYFSDALLEVFNEPARLPEMGSISDDEVAQIRESYWRRVQAGEAPQSGALVIDKFPLNIVVLPLIKAVFPDAKVIFALRDPRDVVLSCYQQRFGMNAAMAQFLDLGAAAAYYGQVMQLYELCRDRLGLPLHQVRYEDVVADLESAARGLCAFLDVKYDPAMLQFRETALKRQIATPSLRQVTQPLYSSSIGRWRRYEQHLQPVLPRLKVWVERFGYEL